MAALFVGPVRIYNTGAPLCAENSRGMNLLTHLVEVAMPFGLEYSTVSRVAAAIWLIPEVIGIIVQRSKAGTTEHDRGSRVILVGGLALGVIASLALTGLFPALAMPGFAILFWIGIVLILAGVALRWYSIAVLGRYFTRTVSLAPGQTVVDTGPYRYIRHPSYSGSLLSLLGFGLVMANWAGLIAVLGISGAALIYRVAVEERALCDGLGQPYIDYMQRTRRFIPFVY